MCSASIIGGLVMVNGMDIGGAVGAGGSCCTEMEIIMGVVAMEGCTDGCIDCCGGGSSGGDAVGTTAAAAGGGGSSSNRTDGCDTDINMGYCSLTSHCRSGWHIGITSIDMGCCSSIIHCRSGSSSERLRHDYDPVQGCTQHLHPLFYFWQLCDLAIEHGAM
jgi:hypothetical protein